MPQEHFQHWTHSPSMWLIQKVREPQEEVLAPISCRGLFKPHMICVHTSFVGAAIKIVLEQVPQKTYGAEGHHPGKELKDLLLISGLPKHLKHLSSLQHILQHNDKDLNTSHATYASIFTSQQCPSNAVGRVTQVNNISHPNVLTGSDSFFYFSSSSAKSF